MKYIVTKGQVLLTNMFFVIFFKKEKKSILGLEQHEYSEYFWVNYYFAYHLNFCKTLHDFIWDLLIFDWICFNVFFYVIFITPSHQEI